MILTKDYERQLTEMLDEWTEDLAKNGGNKSPYAIFANDYHDFDNYVEKMYDNDHLKPGYDHHYIVILRLSNV